MMSFKLISNDIIQVNLEGCYSSYFRIMLFKLLYKDIIKTLLKWYFSQSDFIIRLFKIV